MNTTMPLLHLETEGHAEGLGELVVMDAHLLIRPAQPGQYHRYDSHNSVHSNSVLWLGEDMGQWPMHIITSQSVDEAYSMLNGVFRTFLDVCCMQLWCDAVVNFIVNGEGMHRECYGFDDGNYTMHINVYCGVEDAEAKLHEITEHTSSPEELVIVCPDESEGGYAVFRLDTSEDSADLDDPHDHRDDEPDEDPLAGDVDPTGGCYEGTSSWPWGP